ncbi:MAG: peptidase domain-containing ABC transporter [Spirochaetales bacterium]|nr:peptidase domain-containing ABC transporter [Spirochaetales bacterium]
MFNPFKRFICIKQHDISDCGAACLAMIVRHHGLKIPIARIRELAGTDRMGTNALGLLKAAKQLGLLAKGVKISEEQFTSQIPLPAIAHVVKDNLLHFVVVHKMTDSHVLVADPGEGIVNYKRADFYKIFSGVLILLMPDETFTRGNETSGLFARFLKIVFPHRRLITEIFTASVLFTLLGIAGAFYFKFLLDEVLKGSLESSLTAVSIGMVLLTVFKVLLDAFRKHLLLYLSQKIDVSLIFSYYQHVLKLPMSFFDTRRVGEILSRLNDAAKIREAISGATLSVLIDTLMIIGGGIVLYVQSWQLFLVTLFFIPFSIVVVWAFTRVFQKGNRRIMSEAADTEAYLVESLNGMATIKALNAETETSLQTEKRFLKVIRSGFNLGWLKNFQFSLQNFLTLLGGVLVLWIGGALVIKGQMSMGQLITFNALLVYFFNPIQSLINLQPVLQQAHVAAERLGEILDLEPEVKNERQLLKPEHLSGRIALKNLNFRYGSRPYVLKDINLTVQPGEKIAVVGESGSGKTTLIKLLMKYYLPAEGEILFDNCNIKDLQTENLRHKVGYVPQELFLFSGTIRENLAFGREDINFEEIIRASKLVQAHDFINDLPLRYDTIIGERGATLSGGQKQRVALARAILNDPDILILDEATSSLDSITERAIQSTIKDLGAGKTMFIIAHRLSTITHCDRIVVLDKGQIAEEGTHQELLNRFGPYYRLWESQLLAEPAGERASA